MRVAFVTMFVCIMIGHGSAASWDPPVSTNRRWCTSSNWWFGMMPTLSDIAIINQTDEGPALIDYGCAAVCDDLVISQFGYIADLTVLSGGTLNASGFAILCNYGTGTGTMTVAGGVVDITEYFTVGYYNSGGSGVLNLSDGSVTVHGNLRVGDVGGYGRINMTGGTLTATDTLTMLNGRIVVSSGTIKVADILFFPPQGTWDIRNNGTLVITKDVTYIIGHSVKSITACNGHGTVNISLKGGYTVVTTDCTCPKADLSGDCAVNFIDLSLLAANWLANA